MVDGGSNIIAWMNRAGYTALVPGANDFVLGSENLNRLANEADFPFLMSNMQCDGCKLNSRNIKSYIIKEIDGVKIGILGALILYSSLYDVESIEERRSKRSNKSKEILPDPELIVISSEFQYMTKKSQGFVYKLDDNFFIISTASAIFLQHNALWITLPCRLL